MITFCYQDSLHFNAFKFCIENIRKYYPDSPIFLYRSLQDNKLEEYKKVCSDYNIILTIRHRHQGYISRFDTMEQNLPKMLESHYRIYHSCINSNSEWVMLVEDDVLIKRAIKRWPNSDCGKNRDHIGHCAGGSVFKRQIYIDIYQKLGEDGLATMIQTDHTYSWAGDALKAIIFREHGATEERWVELAEPESYDGEDHAVYHGYKDLHEY